MTLLTGDVLGSPSSSGRLISSCDTVSRERASGANLDSRFNKMTTPASQLDAEAPEGFRVVEISREPIELYKILKFEGMASSGGQAKAAVASGEVLVNKKLETQKRKKIVSGDTIEYKDEKIYIKLSSPISETTTLPEQNVNTEVEAQGPEKE
jgi:ribosome-associated protein